MKKILLLSILFSMLTAVISSQEKEKLISGKVTDSIGIVTNANIINLKTAQGTFSSDQGLFRIFVSKGDSLSVSSIQHISKIIIITEKILEDNTINIQVKSNIYVLDEFDLKRNNLLGILGADTKNVPRNKQDSLLSRVMDFSNVDFSEKDRTIDAIERVRPPIVNTMEGAMGLNSGNVSFNTRSKSSEMLWALRKKLDRQKAFPYKILSELGDKFFFDELKIPIDRYFHFLEYCNPLGIEKLHNDGRQLVVIKILREESVSYLEIIKE